MLETLVFLLLAGVPQAPADAFKKEMVPLQAEFDKLANDLGARTMSPARASFIEGYGVIVSMDVALEPPRANALSLFGGGITSPQTVVANVKKRRKDITDQITVLIKQRVVSLNSIGPEGSLAIAVHLPNYNPADVPDLPKQIVFSVSKANPQMVVQKVIE
jgi:hypothetical protein